jgi:hypothetical protein
MLSKAHGKARYTNIFELSLSLLLIVLLAIVSGYKH